MITRLRRKLHTDQRGFSLPETLVGVLISAFCMATIAAALVAFNYAKLGVDAAANTRSEISFTESRWRSDVSKATIITPADKKVTFTIVNGPECVQNIWEVSADSTRLSLYITTVMHATGGANTSGCAGPTTGTAKEKVLSDVANAETFTYANIAGRPFTRSGSTLTLTTPGAQPAGVTDLKWGSTAIKQATLTTTTGASLPAPTGSASFTQTASRMNVLDGTPSGSTAFNPN